MELTRIPVDADNSADDGTWMDMSNRTPLVGFPSANGDQRRFRADWPGHDETGMPVRIDRAASRRVAIATGRQAPVSLEELRAIRQRRPDGAA